MCLLYRETYFLPPVSGTNRLIQQGAFAMVSPQDVLDVLDLKQMLDSIKTARKVLLPIQQKQKSSKCIDYEPIHIDAICNEVGMAVEKVSAALTMMELKGMVQHVGGMRYAAIHEIHSVKELSMFEHYYAVIMAGGSGTRLWPLSRKISPNNHLHFWRKRTLFQLLLTGS